MKQQIKAMVEAWLQDFDICITRYSSLQMLRLANSIASNDIELLLTLPNEHASQLLKNLRKSKSQFRQDLFVLSELNFKSSGYFVEFGATNGVDLSNTHLLEKEFGWTGILAEPANCWHKDLRNNRSSTIDTRCVWKDSDLTLAFNEVGLAENSTILSFNDNDLHKKTREQGKSYDVNTISLKDLLAEHDAPSEIDYLSIDTEGSEFEILNSFDFCKHRFKVITCEHNFTPMRKKIFELLSKNGYVRKFEGLSKFDDWYVIRK